MNIKQLQHFVTAYDNNSLTKAAQSLSVSQSSISKSIQKLEEELELLLFHRHTRDFKPTDAADQLYRNACQCLAVMDDFINSARYLSQGKSGTLNIGCGPLAHDLIIAPLIKRIINQGSQIKIHIETSRFEELKRQLDRHTFDCLLFDVGELERISNPSDYEVIPLLKKPIYIVANKNHPIHSHTDVMQHLFLYPWVLSPIPQRYVSQLPKEFQDFILNSNKPDFQVTDLHQALDLAERNNLITMAVSDLSDSIFVKRSLKQVKVPFSIYSDIGLWRIRTRNLTPTLKDVILMLKLMCNLK